MREYIDFIQTNPQWSWSLIALVLIAAGLFVRQVVLRGLFIRIKRLSKDLRREIQTAYGNKAILGWACFAIGVMLGVCLWLFPKLMGHYLSSTYWEAIIIFSFIISVLEHAKAYAIALSQVLESRLGTLNK